MNREKVTFTLLIVGTTATVIGAFFTASIAIGFNKRLLPKVRKILHLKQTDSDKDDDG